MTGEREQWDFERQHSPFTIEGQIEASGAFGRGLARRRTTVGRILLGSALVCAAVVIVSLLV